VPVFRYAGMPVCRYAGIPVCRYAGMPVCLYALENVAKMRLPAKIAEKT